jgi:hypothetical protein
MKLSLPLKLGISVVLLFAAVIATCLLWTPVRVRYYCYKINSADVAEGVIALNTLLTDFGETGFEKLREDYRDGKKAAGFLVMNWPIEDIDDYVWILLLTIDENTSQHTTVDVEETDTSSGIQFDQDSGRPLHDCIKNGYEHTAKLLIAKGVFSAENSLQCEHINSTDSEGKTPLELAESEDLRNFLRSRGAKTREELEKSPESRVPGPESKEKK